MPPIESWQLRPAGPADAPQLAEVLWTVRQHAVGQMPAPVHPRASLDEYVARWRYDLDQVWLAETHDSVVGFARFPADWLDSLYILPTAQGCGIGSALLELVKQQRPDGFCLWVFQSNHKARDFYAKHGLVELETTNGELNEERSPDLKLAWLGSDPQAYLTKLKQRAVFSLRDAEAHFVAVAERLTEISKR